MDMTKEVSEDVSKLITSIIHKLPSASDVLVTVDPKDVFEEPEARGDITVSKKDEQTLKYDLDHMIKQKPGYCKWILGVVVVLLFYSAMISSILGK